MLAAGCDEAIGRTLNLGTGREISIGDLAALILKTVGTEQEVVTDDERVRPDGSEVERLIADNTLARDILGWEPQHSLEDGLKTTVEWFKSNMERYRPDAYAV